MKLENVPDRHEPEYPSLARHRKGRRRVMGAIAAGLSAAALAGCARDMPPPPPEGGLIVMPEPPAQEDEAQPANPDQPAVVTPVKPVDPPVLMGKIRMPDKPQEPQR